MAHLSIKQNHSIGKQLLRWFIDNQRLLPWRENRSWYTVWLAEVMLQQTQVATVIPYFTRFLNVFPTVTALAQADLQDVLKSWEGLGYYSRARNLHQAAQLIQSQYQGSLPDSADILLKLPGFGPYITNAVLSIAYNKPLAVVDGNVLRVISRIFCIKDDIRLANTKKEIQNLVNQLIDTKKPGMFNEAIMELGATICLPNRPQCNKCPLIKECNAYATNTISQYPYKSPARQKKTVYALAMICIDNRYVLIVQRPSKGLLAGLWEFPFYKMESQSSLEMLDEDLVMRSYNLYGEALASIYPITHTYTHFQLHLYSRIYRINTGVFRSDFYEQHDWIPLQRISAYPVHRAMTKLVQQLNPVLKIIAKG